MLFILTFKFYIRALLNAKRCSCDYVLMSLTYNSIRSDIEERITKYPNTFVLFTSFDDIFYESMPSGRPREKRRTTIRMN